MIIVADTTPLSELAKVGRLNLLRDVYRQIIIPPEVYNEAIAGTHPAVEQVRLADWIEVRSVSNSQKVLVLKEAKKLGLGECAAIILAEELGAKRLLIDDRNGRREALSRNLPVIGIVGILLLAKQQGLIPEIKDILDALLAQETRISQRLYQYALTTAREL